MTSFAEFEAPPAAKPSGHPRGLYVLFGAEMWERFSYYGMRAILILFMTARIEQGGLGFTDSNAGAVYGMYVAMIYLLSLPGGWIADRFLSQRRSVLYGGIVIASGHFAMAVPTVPFFYLGLVLIILGTGLLKPNVSTIVGQLYAPGDARRDAGFSIFYMGINTGGFIAPLIVGYVGQKVNWHYGFALAGIGMVLGVVQYMAGYRSLGDAGLHPVPPESPEAARQQKKQLITGIVVAVGLAALLLGLNASGTVAITPQGLSFALGAILPFVVIGVFAALYRTATPGVERHRLIAIMALFFASCLFWAVFEQAGSTLNLFADRNTDLHLFGREFPASWFQAINSLFLVILAPVFAWIWISLGPRRDPSSPAKFAAGLVFAGLGLLVLLPVAGLKGVSPFWLILTYLLHTIGELCLSPVGLSAMTKLAPPRIVGLMMGVWFASLSVGNFIAGQVVSVSEKYSYSTLFAVVGGIAVVLGLVLALAVKPLKRLMSGVN